LKCSLH